MYCIYKGRGCQEFKYWIEGNIWIAVVETIDYLKKGNFGSI